MTTLTILTMSLEIKTEKQRMILGWVFAGMFFLLALVASFIFGTPNGRLLAPGVPIMIAVSSFLTVLSVYIYYISNPEVEK